MITLKTCPVCSSQNITKYGWVGISPRRVWHQIMPGVKVQASIVSYYSVCQSCRLIFQNPRLSDQALNKYYSQDYYRKLHHYTSEQADKGEMDRSKTDAKIIKRYIKDINRHLDVGSSRGYLLEEMAAKIKVGVEPNPGRISIKGVKIYPDLSSLPLQKFDLITAIHVLEHVSNPQEYIKKMAGLLDKNGYLVVEVPSGEGGRGSPDLAHLYHFETEVLQNLLKQAGLRIEEILFTPHLMIVCQAKQKELPL
jgi:SAM-dependent methyltransferase